MSQLSDVSIMEAMERGHIGIDPWDPSMLQPASIDVTLGTSWLVPATKGKVVTVRNRDASYVSLETTQHHLHPGEFALATTREVITLSDHVAAKFEGKSSLGRMGIMTHVTAGFIDPGFSGQITLEVCNVSPWTLVFDAGIKIGQLVFTNLDTPASEGYGSKKWGSRYHGQRGATGVRSTPLPGVRAEQVRALDWEANR